MRRSQKIYASFIVFFTISIISNQCDEHYKILQPTQWYIIRLAHYVGCKYVKQSRACRAMMSLCAGKSKLWMRESCDPHRGGITRLKYRFNVSFFGAITTVLAGRNIHCSLQFVVFSEIRLPFFIHPTSFGQSEIMSMLYTVRVAFVVW